jgi:hypothetical protein
MVQGARFNNLGEVMTFNSNFPLGFVPVRKLDGSAWTGQLGPTYTIASGYATSIFTGDPVAVLNDGTIGIGAAGSPIRGIFQGCKYTDTLGNFQCVPYWPGSTTVKTGTTVQALVIDDPNVVFTIQETNGSSAAGTPLALADINLNINFVSGTGNTATGLSAFSINNTTENTTPTLNCKILGLDPTPGNAVGSFANWLVSINNHDLKGGGGTSGV